jgi:hypothetical protein
VAEHQRKSDGELQFHLYWNAWRNGESTWLRERRLGGNSTTPRPDAWGWTDIKAARITLDRTYDLASSLRFIAPDDGNTADRTVAAVSLPQPVAPNGTVDIDIEWTAKIPRPFARTGYIDDYYFFGQWFPKIGVLEDAGWNTHQFHSATEFYSDYGVYDVRMTVPRGYIVGASGREGHGHQQQQWNRYSSLSRRGHSRLRVDDESALHRPHTDVRHIRRCRGSRCAVASSRPRRSGSRDISTQPPRR